MVELGSPVAGLVWLAPAFFFLRRASSRGAITDVRRAVAVATGGGARVVWEMDHVEMETDVAVAYSLLR